MDRRFALHLTSHEMMARKSRSQQFTPKTSAVNAQDLCLTFDQHHDKCKKGGTFD